MKSLDHGPANPWGLKMQRSSDRCFELFSTPLWVGNFSDPDLLADAEASAYRFRDNAKKAALVSDEWNRQKQSESQEEFKAKGVTSFATENLIDCWDWMGISAALLSCSQNLLSDRWDAKGVRMENMWTTIYPKDCYVPEHIHSGFLVSGVFYVKAPDDCGDIVFRDPSWVAKVACNSGSSTFPIEGTRDRWTPTAGDLLLFPSWLPHYTDPNKSETDRIIISFNLKFPHTPERLH